MLAGLSRLNSKATWTLGFLFLAIGCGPDATAPSGLGPISLSVVSGNGQSGVVGTELPQRLVIKATDSRARASLAAEYCSRSDGAGRGRTGRTGARRGIPKACP